MKQGLGKLIAHCYPQESWEVTFVKNGTPPASSNPSPTPEVSSMYRSKRKRKPKVDVDPVDEKLLQILQKPEEEKCCGDQNFLNSLLPDLKAISEEFKMPAKIQIMQALHEAKLKTTCKYQFEGFPSGSSTPYNDILNDSVVYSNL